MSSPDEKRRRGSVDPLGDTADESERGDFAQIPTRPGPHVDHLADGADVRTGPDARAMRRIRDRDGVVGEPVDPDRTPVEHLIERADAMLDAMEAADSVRAGVRQAELDGLPSSEWGRSLEGRVARVEAAIAKPPRRRLLKIAAQYVTIGAVVGALGLSVRALIAHGNGQATARSESEMLHHHERQLRRAMAALNYLAGKFGVELHLDDEPKDPP